MGNTEFRPLQIRPPLTDRRKICHIGDSYTETKFDPNPPTVGVYGQMREI